MQLQLYAKFQSTNIIFSGGYGAIAVSFDEQEEKFINNGDVKLIFAFAITLPITIYLFFVFYAKGMCTYIMELLNSSDHKPSQAVLYSMYGANLCGCNGCNSSM